MVRKRARLRTRLEAAGALVVVVVSVSLFLSIWWLKDRSIDETLESHWGFYNKIWSALVLENARIMDQNTNIIRQNKSLIRSLKMRDQVGVQINVDNVWNQLSETVSVLFFWVPGTPKGEIFYWIDGGPRGRGVRWAATPYQAPVLDSAARTRQAQTGFEWSHEGEPLLVKATPFFSGPRTPYNVIAQGIDVNAICEKFREAADVESVTLLRANGAGSGRASFDGDRNRATYRYPLVSVAGETIGIVEVRADLSRTVAGFSRLQWLLGAIFSFVLVTVIAFIYRFTRRLVDRITRVQETLSAISQGETVVPAPVLQDDDELSVIETKILQQGNELVEKQERLESALEDLQVERDKATQANRAKSEFLAHMSHELRTPLNAILGFSEALQGELFGSLGSPRNQEYVRDIHASGSHLLSVVNDILDMAKIEAEKYELQPECLAVDALIDECTTMVRGRAEASGIDLVLDPPAAKFCIQADHLAMKKCLINLLNNAVKFTPEGGNVTLSVDAEGDVLAVMVRDTGIGVRTEDLSRLTEPFVQVEREKNRSHEGTGLGLPLTKKFVELHGGSLNIESAPGVGTTVTLRVPVGCDMEEECEERAV